MKRLFVFLKGLADRKLIQLEGKSPLEKSLTPNLDRIYSNGELLTLKGAGELAEENFIHLFEKQSCPIPLAPLQCLGKGTPLCAGEIAFSIRFTTSVEGIVLDASDEILSDFEGRAFCEALDSHLAKIDFHCVHVKGPEGVLIGPKQALKKLPAKENPIDLVGNRFEKTLECLEDTVHQAIIESLEKLKSHDVNLLREEFEQDPVCGLLVSGGGEVPDLAPLSGSHLLYTQEPGMVGAAKLLGMELWNFPQEHRRFSHLELIFRGLEEKIEAYDSVYLDLPYIWQSTYKGDLLEKIKTIEYLDKQFLNRIVDHCSHRNIELIVTPLAFSDLSTGRTTSGEVPLLMATTFDQENGAEKFTESLQGVFISNLFEKELATT